MINKNTLLNYRSCLLLIVTFSIIVSISLFSNMVVGLTYTNSSFFTLTVSDQHPDNQNYSLQTNIPVLSKTLFQNVSNNYAGLNSSTIRNDNQVSNDTLLLANIFATDLLNRLYHSASILELTAGLPQVRNISYVLMFEQTLESHHGLPSNKDIEKRQVAQEIISKNDTADNLFEVFYLMPNGDMYMLEPYSIQETLKENNYAFRDYFQKVIQNNQTYLGNAIITTTSSGLREAVIATPVYSLEDNITIAGVWAGGIDFGKINRQLQSLDLINENKRVVFVDGNGEKIADSDPYRSNTFESFNQLISFRNAANGETGTTVESLKADNGSTKTIISYYPVNAFHNTWVVLVMKET